jgi:hypothetical protein
MATNGTRGGSRGVPAGARGTRRERNRFLKTCDIAGAIPESRARRAALLRRLARRGSAVDALVVAFAEPGGTVLTSEPNDLQSAGGPRCRRVDRADLDRVARRIGRLRRHALVLAYYEQVHP